MSMLAANPDDGPTTVAPAAPAAVEPGTATIAEQVTIAADDEFDDGYESDSASAASTSMASSVRDYAFENGRRYHKFREGSYQFPNDEPEQEREDMKHALHVNLCKGKLHYAPLENPQRVLDLGTGTGIWCIDMGDEYPAATVLGIDLSPIQPAWVPPNVKFMVDDYESRWLHGNDCFDFVHGRHIIPITKNLPQMLSEAYRSLKPGAYLEFQEQQFQAFCDDDSMPPDYPVNEWWGYVAQGLEHFGKDIHAVLKLKEQLIEAGFVNVEEKIIKTPIGTWPKDKNLKTVGLYWRSSINDGLEGLSLGPFVRGLNWSADEVRLYLVNVRKALMDRSVHAYTVFHVIYGQKPFDAKTNDP